MENGILKKWHRVPGGKELQLRERLLLFSVFLLISIFIWFLNALSKTYTSDLSYPLEYTDLPVDRVSLGEMPDHLDLKINAHGYALLRYRLFKKAVPISFQVSSYTLSHSLLDSTRAYIQTRYLRDQIARQLPSELQVVEIKPDTLHFRFARRVSKVLPVRPDFHFDVDKQFTLKDGVVLEPDSVMVSGPDLVLDTLGQVTTVFTELGILSKNYEDKVRLSLRPELEYSASRVDCRIDLERYTEVQISLPVEVLNLPDSLTLQTFPSRVKLTCKVGLSKYDRMEESPLRAVVDYLESDRPDGILNVRLENVPTYLMSYDYYPRSVEFLKSRNP